MNSDLNVATHALVYLNHCECIVSSEDLAENICTNPARIRRVLTPLVHVGIIGTKEGLGGGYRLVRSADSITLADVCEALGTRFISVNWRSGDVDMDCLVSSGMADIMGGIYDDLDSLCMEHLRNLTIQDITERIFR